MTYLNNLSGLIASTGATTPKKAKETEKKEEPTTVAKQTKKGGDEDLMNSLASLAQLNFQGRAEVNKKPQGFDIEGIKQQYGDLGAENTMMLSFLSNPKEGQKAVDLFNLAEQTHGVAKGLDIANGAITEFLS